MSTMELEARTPDSEAPVNGAGSQGALSAAPPEQESNVPTQEAIAHLAYSYWQERNGNGGSAEEDWLRAERELRERKPARS